jgi:hypothetical protein
VHVVRDKWKVKIKYAHLEESFRNDLREIYDQNTPFVFVPFGTATGWDGILFECVWAGPFNFYKYSSNAPSSGYTGEIDLRETAS